MALACKQQKQILKKKYILEEGRLIDSKRLREQSWDTDRNPGTQEARPHRVSNQNASISASTVLLLLETTTGHHTGPMNCPKCASFISGCTDLGGRVHCQVLGPYSIFQGVGRMKVKLWFPQWKASSYIPRSHSIKSSPQYKDRCKDFNRQGTLQCPPQTNHDSHFAANYFMRKINIGLLKQFWKVRQGGIVQTLNYCKSEPDWPRNSS